MRRFTVVVSMALAACSFAPVAHAQASAPYLGQILIVSFEFAPKGWAMCNGQLLAINQNQALFSLIGTYYGGDGRTNFALPDLRGRAPIHQGSLAGGSDYVIGEIGGEETVTLTINQIPAHTHELMAYGGVGTTANPTGAVWAAQSRLDVYSSAVPSGAMGAGSIATAGGTQPHDNRSPYLVVNYIIALNGVYPSQN